MLSLLFQITVFIGIIYGMHSAWIYVRDTHTPRKTKQLYDTHNNKYRNILEDLQQQMRLSEQNNQMNTDIDMYCATGDNYTQMNTMERELEEFMKMNFPILIGTSRKSFIGETLNEPVDKRFEGTAASVAVSILNGAKIVRVHDVLEMKKVCKIVDKTMEMY